MGAICMSEPGAGSDLKGLQTLDIDKEDHYRKALHILRLFL
jgi:alkylation response protein AidB-like acyl-CoA dehydrogenase